MNRNYRKMIPLFALLWILFLSACQVNLITEIDKDGAGIYIQEIGFQGDEAMMSGYSEGDETFCSTQMESMPPNTTSRQETRNENELWCVYESPFESLQDLQTIYGMTETRVNALKIEDGTLTYDITLDLSGDSSASMGSDIFWKVTLPGTIGSNNANTQDGNTLIWELRGGEMNNIQATSELGGLNLNADGESPLLYVLGGGFIFLICCVLPLVIGGVVFFLLRKKKSAAKQEEGEVTAHE